MIRVEKVKNRIYLTSARPIAGLGKAVPGAAFRKGRAGDQCPYWSMPLTMEGCLALRERFGEELSIGPDLWAWAKAKRDAAERLGELGEASDATLLRTPERAPQLAEAMASRKYQRVGARFIAEGRNVLIGDQPGLGKTLEALSGVIESGVAGPYLVICPKTAVLSVWAREIPRWVPGARVLTVPDGRAARDKILGGFVGLVDDYSTSFGRETRERTWVVIHPEMARTRTEWVCGECDSRTAKKAGKVVLGCGHDARGHTTVHDHEFPQLFRPIWGAIINDESDRSVIRQTGSLTQTRNGMELIRDLGTREDGFRVAMSGTPFRSRPLLLWSTLNWLRPLEYTSFWNWAATYWEVTQGGWGGAYTIGAMKPGAEERLWASLRPILLRRTKAEVAPDLPPKAYAGTRLNPTDPGSPVGVWLEMDPKQLKAYREMLETSVTMLEGGSLGAVGMLAEMTRLKQFSTSAGRMVRTGKLNGVGDPEYAFLPALPSNKFDWLESRLVEWGFPDDPDTRVIVASQFTEVLELMAKELAKAKRGVRDAIPSVMLTGRVTGQARADVIDRFNTPGAGPNLMFLNTKAGGVAITIDTADRMVVLDETWIPDDSEQLEDRIHRVSKPRPVEYYYLRSLGTIEEGIALTNLERDYSAKRLLDERRGVKYARRVLERSKEL